MKIVKPSFKIESVLNGMDILTCIEKYGRTCYKSEDRITDGTAILFVKRLIDSGHESVLEHSIITVRIVCDRGISHELVRHRIASYSQESTRFCNYSRNKFGKEIAFILPFFWENDSERFNIWKNVMRSCEKAYFDLIESGALPEEARSVLPNSLKTEIIVSMNLREWRHFFKLRTCINAHPQMREISIPLLNKLKKTIPVVFDDLLNSE